MCVCSTYMKNVRFCELLIFTVTNFLAGQWEIPEKNFITDEPPELPSAFVGQCPLVSLILNTINRCQTFIIKSICVYYFFSLDICILLNQASLPKRWYMTLLDAMVAN